FGVRSMPNVRRAAATDARVSRWTYQCPSLRIAELVRCKSFSRPWPVRPSSRAAFCNGTRSAALELCRTSLRAGESKRVISAFSNFVAYVGYGGGTMVVVGVIRLILIKRLLA